jgi:pimeloyl-ACP methyl ester carboxylesterase
MQLARNRVPGLVVTEHWWELPLDHREPDGEQIGVFAREVVAQEKADKGFPWIVFFNGGPGLGCCRPLDKSGWIKRASEEFRVLLLDQRGTGRSTAVDAESVTARGDAEAQAAFLCHFRADAIVRDAELIRRELSVERWSVLGQSFGGFCVMNYLSFFPGSLKEALITGGVPPLDRSVDHVYRATYRRMLDRNRIFYDRYPQDVERVYERCSAGSRWRTYGFPQGTGSRAAAFGCLAAS